MRIAILTNILTPYRVPFFEELAMRCNGFAALLMAERHDNRSWKLPPATFAVNVLPGIHVRPPGWEEPLHLNFGVGRWLRRFRPDVILNGAYTLANFSAYRFCRRAGIHNVPWGELTLHDGADRSSLRRYLRRTMIGGSSACIASSSLTRDTFAHYGMPLDRILLSLMPVQTEFFAAAATQLRQSGQLPRLRARYGSPLLLAVGQLIDRKGIPELLNAMQFVQLRWPNVTLALAGDGPQREVYERRAVELGLHDVRFLGFKSPDELAQLYAATDAFVFPTRFDTFGAVIPEAMAAGAIVVASIHAAATQDLLVDGETGFTVLPDNPRQLAAGIALALELSPEKRLAMSRLAVQRACANSYAAAAQQCIDFLKRLPLSDC